MCVLQELLNPKGLQRIPSLFHHWISHWIPEAGYKSYLLIHPQLKKCMVYSEWLHQVEKLHIFSTNFSVLLIAVESDNGICFIFLFTIKQDLENRTHTFFYHLCVCKWLFVFSQNPSYSRWAQHYTFSVCQGTMRTLVGFSYWALSWFIFFIFSSVLRIRLLEMTVSWVHIGTFDECYGLIL